MSLTAPGDTLFFHYSGHGTQVPTDHDDPEVDGLDEAIVPVDMNLIVDDDLRLILCQLPLGARMTMLADCCHSGTMMDHPILQLRTGHTTRQLDSSTAMMPDGRHLQQFEGRDYKNRCADLPLANVKVYPAFQSATKAKVSAISDMGTCQGLVPHCSHECQVRQSSNFCCHNDCWCLWLETNAAWCCAGHCHTASWLLDFHMHLVGQL